KYFLSQTVTLTHRAGAVICRSVALDATQENTRLGWVPDSYVDPIPADAHLRDALVSVTLKHLQDPLLELALAFAFSRRNRRDPVAGKLQIPFQNLHAPLLALVLNLLGHHRGKDGHLLL